MSQELTIINPLQLLSQAVSAGCDVDQLEKLMGLQERFKANEAKTSFFRAKSMFQAEKPELKKSKDVEFKGRKQYSYAPLSEIQKALDPIISKYGLSYHFEQEMFDDGKIKVTCVVSHVDGHVEKTWLASDKDTSGSKNSIQSIGSTVSFLQRYTLKNAFGLSEGDDDGLTATFSEEEVNTLALAELSTLFEKCSSLISPDQKKRISDIIENKEVTSYKKAIKLLNGKLGKSK